VNALAQAARGREQAVLQEELLAHCRQLERNIRHTIHTIEASKEFDPQWLAAARMQLNTGLMQLVRAVTRKDFF
jgi:hypothetical protein